MAQRKLSDEERSEIVERYRQGESSPILAAAYEVHKNTILKVIKQAGVLRPKSARSDQSQSVADFAKRCRSILWRQDKDHATYEKWQRRAEELESPDGGGYTRYEAVVRAAKEFPCLRRLFREYDVSLFDPNPESHPDIQNHGVPLASAKVTSQNVEQSHRENLRWAIDAAGTTLRTGMVPTSCPNDAAYYLYRQAIEEPRDFLSRFNQVEGKEDGDASAQRSIQKSGKRAVAEIEAMLDSLG